VVKDLCVLYINDYEVFVYPKFDPTKPNPIIEDLFVFLGVVDGHMILERSPSWLIDMANNELYDDLMVQYD